MAAVFQAMASNNIIPDSSSNMAQTRNSNFEQRFFTGISYSQVPSPELTEDDVWESDHHDETNLNFEPSSLEPEDSDGEPTIENRKDEGDRAIGGLLLAFEDSNRQSQSRILHKFHYKSKSSCSLGTCSTASAPVNVPVWPKFLRIHSAESMTCEDYPEEWDRSEMIPPHEYLARRTATKSIVEGAGRTLKGRDMRRVRDAVWSQTGFFG